MFDDPRDINRDLGTNPYRDRGAMMGEGSGWGVPLALLAIVVIIGGLIAFAPTTNQQTASNQPARRAQRAAGVTGADDAAGHHRRRSSNLSRRRCRKRPCRKAGPLCVCALARTDAGAAGRARPCDRRFVKTDQRLTALRLELVAIYD